MNSRKGFDRIRGGPRTAPNWKLVALVAAFILCLSSTGWAQSLNGTIVGIVKDSSGAVVPGAKVIVESSQLGITRETTSNAAGEYTVALLPLGIYNITAEAAGFQKQLQTGLKLDVNQTLRVDIQLTVGQVTQEITVSGGAVKVNTENASLSGVISANQVKDLNLNGRNWMSLTVLVPGVSPMNENNFNPLKVGFGNSQLIVSFGGSRPTDSSVELDGANLNQESGSGRNNVVFPVIDSIAEFRITTSSYSAETGKRPGATIQIATKAGTRDFHGTLYEFVRNDHMDANAFFINQRINPPGGNAPKQPLKWNTYGYNIGGPFYIPGHYNVDKTRTFFFWNEGWAPVREGTVKSFRLPTLLMRQGNFNECDPTSAQYNSAVYAGGSCRLPVNPATGLKYTGNIVPIDPTALTMMNGLIPLPNSGVQDYVNAPSLPKNWRQENIRVDQNIKDNTRLFGRYTSEHNAYSDLPGTYDTLQRSFGATARSAVFNLNHSFKPTLLNEFIGAWVDVGWIYFALPSPSSVSGNVHKPAGWAATNIFPANANNKSTKVLPQFNISGGLPFSATVQTSLDNTGQHNKSVNIKDNIIWTKGRHTLKFGAFFLDWHGYGYSGNAPQGTYTFNGSGPISTTNGLADFFTGRIAQYNEATAVWGTTAEGGWGTFRGTMRDFETYAQDDFKVSSRLTLNLGVRYMRRGPWYDRQKPVSRSSGFYPELYNPAVEAQLDAAGHFIPGTGHDYTTNGNGLIRCGINGVPQGCLTTDSLRIQPRFGFAYDLSGNGKTAIRGGFGIFTDTGYSRSPGGTLEYGPPPVGQSPSVYNVVGYTNVTTGILGPTNLNAFPEKGRRPTIAQFNLTLEHEFPGANVVTMAYQGRTGRHLDRAAEINQIPLNPGIKNVPSLAGKPGCDASGNCDVNNAMVNNLESSIFFRPYRGYTDIVWTSNTGVSNYHSLQASLRHQTGHGLSFGAAYTYSRSIDDGSDGTSRNGIDDWNNLTRWRGLSEFDRTQVVQLNYIYDLPFFRNSPNHFVKTGLGGWQFSGISSFFTGIPLSITCNHNGNSNGIGKSMRCNSLPGFAISKSVANHPTFGPTLQWFNPATITMANRWQFDASGQPGMFGDMGRNTLHGPGRDNFDLALIKNFALPWFSGEHSNLQFRWETFNSFNHTQFETIQAGCNGATAYGAPCTGAVNPGNGMVVSTWSPRQMQFGLKYTF